MKCAESEYPTKKAMSGESVIRLLDGAEDCGFGGIHRGGIQMGCRTWQDGVAARAGMDSQNAAGGRFESGRFVSQPVRHGG